MKCIAHLWNLDTIGYLTEWNILKKSEYFPGQSIFNANIFAGEYFENKFFANCCQFIKQPQTIYIRVLSKQSI